MKQWYVLAYDIRDPRRLQRVHYFLRKKALALQNSVFLVNENRAGLQEIVEGIRERADNNIDDIRLYPLTHPNVIWAAGKQADAMSGLYGGKQKQDRPAQQKGFFKTLMDKMKRQKETTS